MRFPILIAIFCALPVCGFAQSTFNPNESKLFIGPEVCRWAVEHTADSDVAYKGGVDVDGNPVAPASMGELRQQALGSQLLKEMNIELTSDLAAQLGIPERIAHQRINVGTVEIDENEQLSINGEPLTNPDPAAWVAACGQAKQH